MLKLILIEKITTFGSILQSYKNYFPMSKSLLILVLFFNLLNLSAQEDYDSTYIDDFKLDTNKTRHIGLEIGTFMQGIVYTDLNTNNANDSLSILSSEPQQGFCVGIIIERDLGERLWLHSGININISSVSIKYSLNDNDVDYNFNYSTLEIPLWLQYSFKNKRRGLSWGGGISPCIDITKVKEKELRNFHLKNMDLLIGTGPNLRWMLPTGAYINIGLRVNYGLINIIDKSSTTIYNQKIDYAHRWQTTLLVSIN